MTTDIAWTDETWNPLVGCSVTSPGCTNCYAMKMAARLEAMGTPHYKGLTEKVNGKAVWTGQVAQASEKTLTQPLRWKKPRMIFVNSMGDLFHPDVPDEWIDRVFAVMALCPWHILQILTKQSERMRDYVSKSDPGDWSTSHIKKTNLAECYWDFLENEAIRSGWVGEDIMSLDGKTQAPNWPLPNVWLGVSAEDQKRADERIPLLLDTPAAVRFVSVEPQLEQIDLTSPKYRGTNVNQTDWLDDLNWVICGAESGPGARPFDEDWARSLRDQCDQHTDMGRPWSRAFFYKQKIENGRKVETPELDGRRWTEFPRSGLCVKGDSE